MHNSSVLCYSMNICKLKCVVKMTSKYTPVKLSTSIFKALNVLSMMLSEIFGNALSKFESFRKIFSSVKHNIFAAPLHQQQAVDQGSQNSPHFFLLRNPAKLLFFLLAFTLAKPHAGASSDQRWCQTVGLLPSFSTFSRVQQS